MNKLYTLQFVVRAFSRHRTLRPQRGPIASGTFVTHLGPVKSNSVQNQIRGGNLPLPESGRGECFLVFDPRAMPWATLVAPLRTPWTSFVALLSTPWALSGTLGIPWLPLVSPPSGIPWGPLGPQTHAPSASLGAR